MNILLVDDDYFVVAALEKKIDWKALSIEQVYTAYSVAQARDILRRIRSRSSSAISKCRKARARASRLDSRGTIQHSDDISDELR